MKTYDATLMELTVVDGVVLCEDGRPFDREGYSHFKYGYVPPAIEYGNGLAALIGDRLFELANGERIVIVSAPYKYLPTASHAISIAMLHALSRQALQAGYEPPLLVPFHKANTGSAAYAKSSEAERLRQLATMGLHLDESYIPGSHVLVVDDIRITGTAQKVSAEYLEPLQPASIWYLHAARLPMGIGKVYPHLEDELNQTVTHSLEIILQQAVAGQFELNTRVLRLILETDVRELKGFAEVAPLSLLMEIHQAGMGSGLVYYQRYQHALKVVNDGLQRRVGNRKTGSSIS
jgi:hypothetical protein